MYYVILILTAVLTAWCCGAEPPIEASLSDGARMQQRWNDSLYAKIWNDPALDDVRAEFEKSIAEANAEVGYDVRALLLSLKSAGIRLIDVTKDGASPMPTFLMQADFAGLTGDIFQKWQEKSTGQPAIIDAADAAFTAGSEPMLTVAQFGTTVVAGNASIESWKVPADDNDLHVTFELKTCVDLIRKCLDEAEAQKFDEELAPHLAMMPEWFSYDISIVPEGLLERARSPKPAIGVKAVDVAILDQFPATTLMAGGLGVDGKAMWKECRDSVLNAIGKMLGSNFATPDEIAKVLNEQILAANGLTMTIDQLVEDIDGTFALAVMPSQPWPTVAIVFPQTPGIEQLLALGVGKLPAEAPIALPPVGDHALLPIPNVPIPITLARNTTNWLITTDVQFAQQWASGMGGGWKNGVAGTLALSKAPADAYVVGGSDTCAVVQTASPFLNMAMASAEPDKREKMAQFLDRLASIVSPGYIVAGSENGEGISEQRGILGGSMFTYAMIAAIALPNVMAARQIRQANPPQAEPAF